MSRHRMISAIALAVAVLGPLGATTAAVTPTAPAKLVLRMASLISVYRFAGLKASVDVEATGRIELVQDPQTGTWGGIGNITSDTSSNTIGCPSVNIRGHGVYDWVVREAIVAPGMDPAQIVVRMDSGNGTTDTPENPDTYDIDDCVGHFSGVTNTWENLFFQVHRADYEANGLEVTGWVADFTAWQTGGTIALASWPGGTCGTGASAAGNECTELTFFELNSVAAVPTGTPLQPLPASSSTPTPPPPSSASAGPSSAVSQSPAPSSVAPSSPAPSTSPAAGTTCTGSGCFPTAGIIVGLAALIAVAAAALWLRARRPGLPPSDGIAAALPEPAVVPGAGLDYDNLAIPTVDHGKGLPLGYGNGSPGAPPLEYAKDAPLEYAKHAPLEFTKDAPLEYTKHAPDAQQLDYGKHLPGAEPISTASMITSAEPSPTGGTAEGKPPGETTSPTSGTAEGRP